VHGPIEHIIGYVLMGNLVYAFKGWNLMVWIIGGLTQGIVTIAVADVFWRAVDAPSVRIARWMEGICLSEK
jgi:hypothetical protein